MSRRCIAARVALIVPEGALLPLDRATAHGLREWEAGVEEREAGVASVSAAVRDQSGQVLAAVSVSGPIERLSRQPGDRFGAAVASAAEQIERALKESPPARSALS